MTTEFLEVANNATGTLADTISAAATSLTLGAGEGANFPSTFPSHLSIGGEIIRFDDRASDLFLSLSRGQEGTTAVEHLAGAAVEGRLTAKHIADLAAATNVLEAAPAEPSMTYIPFGTKRELFYPTD